MLKSILILCFSLFFLDSGFSMGAFRPKPKKPAETLPAQTAPITSSEGLKVAFQGVSGFITAKEIELVAAASNKLHQTVNSQCFRDFMLGSKLLETNGKTNLEVVNQLTNFNDIVPVKIYYKKWGCKIGCTSAIAYRSPPHKTINLNRSFFTASRSSCRWAATMAHEALGHALGNYGHSSEWNVNREYTVPYKMSGAKEQYGSNAFDKCCVD